MVANRIEVAVAMWLAWLRGGGFFGIDSFCSRLRASLSLIWCVMAVASHLVHLVFVVDLFARRCQLLGCFDSVATMVLLLR